jgi:hypothetical protein
MARIHPGEQAVRPGFLTVSWVLERVEVCLCMAFGECATFVQNGPEQSPHGVHGAVPLDAQRVPAAPHLPAEVSEGRIPSAPIYELVAGLSAGRMVG